MVELLSGNCLELMKDIEDKSVDMILCDLPYGTTQCKWDSVIPFEPLWEQYERIIKDNGAIVLFGSQPFTSALIMSNLKLFKHQWFWNKRQSGSPITAKYMPLKIIEDICVFAKGKSNYYPIMRKGKMKLKGGKSSKNEIMGNQLKPKSYYSDQYYPTCYLDFGGTTKIGRLHPTQKPVALLEYLIKTYTKQNETVLDNCMGSGSTGIACLNTNRQFIGMELDKTYFEIAKKRIEENQL